MRSGVTSGRFAKPGSQSALLDSYRSVNVLMESIIDLYKAECIDIDIFHAELYKSVGEVEYATAGWVD